MMSVPFELKEQSLPPSGLGPDGKLKTEGEEDAANVWSWRGAGCARSRKSPTDRMILPTRNGCAE